MPMPPPRPNQIYTGPAIPQTYDPNWRVFQNLTPAQVLAFQSFPQDLMLYAKTRRWLAEMSGITVAGIPLTTQDRDQAKVAQLKQAFDNGTLTTPVHFFAADGTVHAVNAATATAIYQGIVVFVQQTYETAATLVAGINASTVTTRSQIDAAYAAVAPNSPSAVSSAT